VGLTDLTPCEILQGIRTECAAARALKQLHRFEVFTTGGVELAT
jgi:hypothetical protein